MISVAVKLPMRRNKDDRFSGSWGGGKEERRLRQVQTDLKRDLMNAEMLRKMKADLMSLRCRMDAS